MDTPRKPDWLRARLPGGPGYAAVRKLVDGHKLHTVCQSAQCPNLGECWSRGTALSSQRAITIPLIRDALTSIQRPAP